MMSSIASHCSEDANLCAGLPHNLVKQAHSDRYISVAVSGFQGELCPRYPAFLGDANLRERLQAKGYPENQDVLLLRLKMKKSADQVRQVIYDPESGAYLCESEIRANDASVRKHVPATSDL